MKLYFNLISNKFVDAIIKIFTLEFWNKYFYAVCSDNIKYRNGVRKRTNLIDKRK